MEAYPISRTDLLVSRLGYGCMNLGGAWDRAPLTATDIARAAEVIDMACEQGITLFDHADIYTFGKSEAVFGELLQQRPGVRESMVIQSKCGIRFEGDPVPGAPQRYDFSYEHIIASVEGSLRRLRTEYLDLLLLHRPDPLMEPEEVARAFAQLQSQGKVRYFGVSNHTSAQIALLQRHVEQPLVVNQVELNLLHASLIEDGILANQAGYPYAGAAGTLDYCRLHGILVQAWSPVAGGALINPPADASPRTLAAASMVATLAAEKQSSREAIVLAWLLKHPAPIQPIVGTTNRERLRASCLADQVELSREEWYALFTAARGVPLP